MLSCERGQTTSEYAIVLAVITVGVILTLAGLSTAISSKLQTILAVFPS